MNIGLSANAMIVEMGGLRMEQAHCHGIFGLFDWSHDHLGWTIRTWRRVHWSDESRFLLCPTEKSCKGLAPTSAHLDMSLSSLGVVLRGLPARGWSVTFPV
jgi:hypothetical protein